MDDKYTYVQAQLKRRAEARQLARVADLTNVSRRTIGNILEGKGTRYATVAKLFDFLRENVRRKEL